MPVRSLLELDSIGEEASSSCHHDGLEPPLRKPGDDELVSGGASDEEPRDRETPLSAEEDEDMERTGGGGVIGDST